MAQHIESPAMAGLAKALGNAPAQQAPAPQASAAPAVEQPQAQPPQETPVSTPTNAQPSAAQHATPPAQEPSTETPTAAEAEQPVDPLADIDWGTPAAPSADKGTAPAGPDWAAISQELGFQATSPKDIAEKYRSLQAEHQKLKESNGLSDPRLVAAQKAAEKGIDPMEYLRVSSTDYDKIPDEKLVEIELMGSGEYQTEEEAREAIDGMDKLTVRTTARQLRATLKRDAASQLRELESAAQEQQRQTLRNAEAAIQAFDGHKQLGMKDEDAAAFKARYKADFENNAFSKYLFDANGNLDMAKVVEARFWTEHGPRAIEHVRRNAATQAKGTLVRNMANAAPLTQQGRGTLPDNSPVPNLLNGLKSMQGGSQFSRPRA